MIGLDKQFRAIHSDVRYTHIPTPQETYDYLLEALVSDRLPPYKANSRIRAFLRFCCGIHGAAEILSVRFDEGKTISLHVHTHLESLLPNGGEGESIDKDYFVSIWCSEPDCLYDDDFEDVPNLIPFENRIRVVLKMTELGFHQRFERKEGKFKYELAVGPDRLLNASVGNSLAGVNESLYEGSLAWLNDELSEEKGERWFRSSLDIMLFVDLHMDILVGRLLPGRPYTKWAKSRIVDNATATVMIGMPCELRLKSKLDGAEIEPNLTLEFCLSTNAAPVVPYVYLTAAREEWPDDWYPEMEAESLREAAKEIIGDSDWIEPIGAQNTFYKGAAAIAEPYEFPLQKKDSNLKSDLLAWLSILTFRLYSLFNPSHGKKEGGSQA